MFSEALWATWGEYSNYEERGARPKYLTRSDLAFWVGARGRQEVPDQVKSQKRSYHRGKCPSPVFSFSFFPRTRPFVFCTAIARLQQLCLTH